MQFKTPFRCLFLDCKNIIILFTSCVLCGCIVQILGSEITAEGARSLDRYIAENQCSANSTRISAHIGGECQLYHFQLFSVL